MRKLAIALVACGLAGPVLAQSPGGISSNLRLWLKADEGVTGAVPVTQWDDQSLNGFAATPTGNQPHILFDYINYYPVIDFNAANSESLTIPSGIFGAATYTSAWVYIVSRTDRLADQSHLFEALAGGVNNSFDVIIPWSNANTYYDFGDRTGSGRINGAWGASLNYFNIWTYGSNTTTATPSGARKSIYRDGQQILTNANNSSPTGNNQPLIIGGGYADGVATTRPFDGQISEIIVYTGVPSIQEQEQIHSYLSMKYGVTKQSLDNGTTAGVDERDYFNSAGTVLWDYSNNTTYHFNIATIGRDDGSELSQSKGRSLTGNIIMDAGAPMTNDDFILVGDNNATPGTSPDVDGSYVLRSNKIWKVSTTGTPGLISLSIELDDLGIPSGLSAASYVLLQDADETFATGALPHTAGASITNNVLTFTGVTLAHDQFFAIATTAALKGPANVTTNLKMWLRADKNVTGSAPVSQWDDHSGNGFNATSGGSGPSRLATDANFNPALDFVSASTQYMQVAQGILGNNQNNDAWVYVVNKPDVSQTHTIFYEQAQGVGEVFNFLGPWSAGANNVYYEFGANAGTGRINTAWGGAFGNYYMWTLGSSTGTATPSGFRKSISRDGALLQTNNNNDNLVGNNQPLYIAGGYNTGIPTSNMFDGKIAEIIMYTGVPSIMEQELIHSYLAIKYGLTKTSADDGITPEDERDYFASDETVVFDYSSFTSYLNNIAIIGRDDVSELDQRTSRGQSSAAILTLDKGGALPNDLDFIAAGDNGAAAGYNTDVPGAYERRINKIWRIQVTGTPGNISVSVNLRESGIPFGLAPANYALLIDTDDTFAAGATPHVATSVSGGVVTFTNVSLTTANFLSVAILDGSIQGPAAVTENLRFWLKGNSGTTGSAPMSAWADQSGNGFNASVPANGPDVITDAVNFNPAIDFTQASTEYLQVTNGIWGTLAVPNAWVYYILRGDNTTNQTVFNENLNGGRFFSSLNPWGANVYYMTGNNNDGQGRISGPSGLTLGKYHMWTLGTSTGTATPAGTNKAISRDGEVILTTTTTDTGNGTNQNLYIGGWWTGTSQNFHDGRLAEMIVYNSVPTIQEQEKIQSYLSIKYGITKNSIDNLGSPEDDRDYFASDGTVLWDYDNATSVYHNNLTVIGRDDASLLSQPKSKSVNLNGDLTIDKGGALPGNLDFIAAGDNNVAASYSTDVPPALDRRLSRIWRTQVTGTPGTVTISIDLTEEGLPFALQPTEYRLLVDTDETFATGATEYTGATVVAGTVTFNNVALTGVGFLTVAIIDGAFKGPGDVRNNIRAWFKADAGTAGTAPMTSWTDQSGNGFVASVPAAGPDLVPNAINSNPSIDFTQANSEYLQVTNGILPAGNLPDAWTYYVMMGDNTTNQTVFYQNLTGDHFASLNPWGGNVYYMTGNNTDGQGRLSGVSGLILNRYHMWTLGSSTGTATPSGTNKAISRDGAVILTGPTTDTGIAGAANFYIGGFWSGPPGFHHDGRIAEMVIYNTVPTILEQEKVQSYLSIKYGLMKNSVDNLGSPEDERDYFASDATVVWDYSNNTAYHNDVTVIGRDDNSELDQRRSIGHNPTADITLEHAAAFGTDLQFVSAGDNNAAAGISFDVPVGYDNRLNKVWRTQVTGAPGNISVSINMTDLGLPDALNPSDYALLVDGDDVFINAATAYLGASVLTGVVTFNGVALTGTQYVTVATVGGALHGPGDVISNIRLWLRADVGVTGTAPVTNWADQSGNGFQATAGAAAPDLITNQMNFNAVLDFTRASSEYLQVTGGITRTNTYADVWTYYVARNRLNVNNTVLNENLAGGEYYAVLNPWSGTTYYNFGNTTSPTGGRVTGPWGGTNGEAYMWTMGTSTGNATPSGFRKAVYRNGALTLSNDGLDTGTGNNQPLYIGGRWTGANSEYFDGEIAELVVYTGVPSALEQERIQSYFAIKYGLSKNSADIGLTPEDERDHFASNSAVIWDFSANATYNNNIAGIGRDDNSFLDQRKSRSINVNGDLTLDKGAAFPTDMSYVVGGDNNPVFGTSTDVPAGYDNRITKIWRTQVTGTPGNISVSVIMTDLGLPDGLNAADYALLVDTDDIFANSSVSYLGATNLSGVVTFTGVSLTGTQYITVAAVAGSLRGPGDVTANIRLWLRADVGVTGTLPVTNWADQSNNGLHATAGAAAPDLVSSQLNFNPVLDFTRANSEHLQITGGLVHTSTYNDVWTYYVARNRLNVNNTLLNENLAGAEYYAVLNPWSGTTYYQFGNSTSPTGGRVTGAWGGSNGEVYMWTMGTSTGNATPSGFRKAVYRNGALTLSNDGLDTGTGANQPLYIGGRWTGANSEYFDGEIAELVVYTGVPSALEQEKVQSYFAIKYGLPKNSTDIGLTPEDERDHFASNNAVIWDFSDNPTYNNNIAGIGRDDLSFLDQRKSKSQTPNADLTLDKAGAFPTDLAYIVAGDNNAAYGSSTDVPAGMSQRLTKVFRARVTGAPGTVSVTIDINNLGLPNALPSAAYSLVIDSDDGVFTNASTHTTGVVNTSGIISFTGVTIPNGAYFTVAFDESFMKGPGDVTHHLRLWLKANAGVGGATPVTSWSDQSGYSFHATVPGNGPDLMADQANFNPSLDFTRPFSEYLQITGGIVKTLAVPEAWVYYVSRADVSNVTQTIFNENLAAVRYFSGLNPYNGIAYYMTGNNTDNQGRISVAWGGTLGQYHMWTNGSSPGTSTPTGSNKAISRDGAVIATGTTTDTGSGNNQNFYIGGRWTGANADYFDGQIAELIAYNGVPTVLEQEKVQSYLAIKYGIMKNSADNVGTGGTDERDYLASNATVLWDYSTLTAYHNNIVGVGRDDDSELDQRKSRNVSPGGHLTIDKGGAFSNNLDFIICGDNNVGGSSTDVPTPTLVKRSARVWRSDVTGTPGDVSLTFNLADLGLPPTFAAAQYALLIDTDDIFAAGATVHTTGASIASGQFTVTNVPLTDGTYFTVAMAPSAFRGPGSVTLGLQLWLKAGMGVTGSAPITQWNDQSGLDRNAVTVANGPSLLANEINSNPAVDFNRSLNQYMHVPTGVLHNGSYTSTWAFVVSKADGLFNSTVFFEGLGNKVFDALIPWSDGVFYSEFGTNNTTGRVNAAWGGNITNYFMWTAGHSTGTSTPSGARKTIYRNGTVLTSNANNDSGTGANQPFILGGGYAAGSPVTNNFDGKVAEMIVYSSVPSILEQEKVHSYLGIKYGIVKTTIDNVTSVGTDERDYFASDGSVIWDFTNWGVYTSNAFGVGRDDGSELDQRRSKANNGGGYLTIEHSAAFSTDLSFIICADNGPVTGTSADVPIALQRRTSKVWRADLTGTPGTVSLTFDLADLALLPALPVGNYAVLLDADGTFATGATVYTTGASLSSGQFTVTGVTLAEGMYITIGVLPGAARGPANVSNNLHLWLKADMGVTGSAPVTAWADQSGFDRHANSTTAGPTLVANEFNFNPGLDFVSASFQHLAVPGGIMKTFGLTSVWVYAVSKNDIIQDNTLFYENLSGGEWFTGLVGYTGNNIYYDYGNGGGTGRVSGAWGGAVSTAYIWTLAASTSAATPNTTNRAIYRNGLAFLANNNADNGTGINATFTIGAGYNTGASNLRNFDGKVAELIVFNGTPTIQEQELIHSYLALKYGITKASGNNGATGADERDYFATDASVTWDFSVNTTYNNRIFGIGRDGELNQTTSTSNQTTGILRISNPSNLDDLEYLIVGDNNGAVNAGGITDRPAATVARIARTWKTAVKGSPGSVSLRFDLSTAPGPKDASHLVLCIDRDKDGVFTDETVGTGGVISGAVLISGETFEWSGITLTDGELVSVGSTSGLTPLPIVLLSFDAAPEDGMIHLTWSTASELNNDYFKLHRSYDGAEFGQIAVIKGQGTTSEQTDYEYYDEQINADIIYYRLTQVDVDGLETYSKVVSVRPDQVPFDFRIVPNPADNQVTVRVFNAAQPDLWLMNAQGVRIVVPRQRNLQQGYLVDVSQLSPGLYLVAVSDGGKTLTKKLIKK